MSAAWALIKTFLDEKTRKKIHILGSNYQKTLFNVIDREVLPDFLGGTSSGLWPSNKHTPWYSYLKKCKERKCWFNENVYPNGEDKIGDPMVRARLIQDELDTEKTMNNTSAKFDQKTLELKIETEKNKAPLGLCRSPKEDESYYLDTDEGQTHKQH